MKTSRSNTTSSFAEKQVQFTAGEVFPDGSAIELIADPKNSDELRLLFWDGKKATVLPEVAHDERIFRPIRLHPSLERAVGLARGIANYGDPAQFFTKIATLFEQHIGLPQPEASACTLWVATTHFPDLLPSPPALVISGSGMDQAVEFLWLLHCLTRHPLLLAGVSRSAIRSLPLDLRFTLLVNGPDLPPKDLTFLRNSNYRRVSVCGSKGKVLDMACSKGIYVGPDAAPDSWGERDFRLMLPPRRPDLAPLDERRRNEIADQNRPRFLLFRLRHLARVWEAGCEIRVPEGELDCKLARCVEGAEDIAKAAAPLLQRQAQDALAWRSSDFDRAMIRALWVLLHQKATGASPAEIARFVNVLLRDLGEILLYSPEDVGRKLVKMHFHTDFNGKGKILRFTREASIRIHELARSFGLTLPAGDGCPDCAPPEVLPAV